MKFNNRYSENCHAKPFIFKKPSLTDQSFAFDTDINNIVAGYAVNNPALNFPKSDISGRKFITADDYQNSVYKLAEAKSAFEELPSKLRLRFHNDPKEMLQFISDEKNTEECIKLGLKQRVKEPDPVVVTVKESVTASTPEQAN